MDCCLPGSSVLGDFPGKNSEVGCQFPLQQPDEMSFIIMPILLMRKLRFRDELTSEVKSRAGPRWDPGLLTP